MVKSNDNAAYKRGQELLDQGMYKEAVEQFDEAGAIESVKAASDIMSPLSGVVIEVNDDVIDNPELINEDPYTNWIFKLELSDASEVDNLLSKEDYEKEIDE